MLDYDLIDDWAPQLERALADAVPATVRQKIAGTRYEFVEDALEDLLRGVDRGQVVERALRWITEGHVLAYHGTRLTQEDVISIGTNGLQPLVAMQRRGRLQRALCSHRSWKDVESKLDDVLRAHSGVGGLGREGQVHLTLSRSGLVNSFNHYLAQGSELDGLIAYDLLGDEGRDLLATDGTALVVKVAVPGRSAIEGTQRYVTMEQTLVRGVLPNLVAPFLEAWAFKLSDPAHQSSQQLLDCGIWYCEAVPAKWIVGIEPP